MSIDPLKSSRIPFEIRCAGCRIQITALTEARQLMLRLMDAPSSDTFFHLGLQDCPTVRMPYPQCYRAYRLSHKTWLRLRQRIIDVGYEIVRYY